MPQKKSGATGILVFDFELFIGARCQKQRVDRNPTWMTTLSSCQLLPHEYDYFSRPESDRDPYLRLMRVP
jgi:hypothetical protein